MLFILVVVLIILLLKKDGTSNDMSSEPGAAETLSSQEADLESQPAAVTKSVKEDANETDDITLGIDVSEFQRNIDWDQAADFGIDFVMVRVGYRTAQSGTIKEDACARYNLQEAAKRGIRLGAYFYSTAITEEEAIEEAKWVCEFLAGYPITYPVAFNCEGFRDADSRQNGLTVEERSHLAEVFLKEIEAQGYIGMFYAARNEMADDLLWQASVLEQEFRIWVAQYPENPGEYPDYDGAYVMWQYSNEAQIPGISTEVDINRAYFGYRETASPKKEGAAEKVDMDLEVGISFEEVSETVTAKDVTNLRSTMEQIDSNVVYQLKNGETVTRTGIGVNGWSRVLYNGQTLYAVSSYLTTDLSYTPPAPVQEEVKEEQTSEESGVSIKTQFTEVNESVTAKDVTNLRSIPSIEEPSEVLAQLHYGEWITRTGISDVGWSRVEYDGQTMYCISSYLSTAP